jgi:hypothetical protein
VQLDGNDLGECVKVAVRRKHRVTSASSHRAQQVIGIGALHAAGPAAIEKLGSPFKIVGGQL